MYDPQEQVETTSVAHLTTPLVVEPGSRLLTTEEQETFEALSLEVFGATSRWATMLKKGIPEVVTETVTEYIPATDDKPEEYKEHQLPVYLDQAKKSVKMVQRRFTAETLMTYMLERKKQFDLIKAFIAKQQEEAKAKADAEKLAKHLAENVSGAAQ